MNHRKGMPETGCSQEHTKLQLQRAPGWSLKTHRVERLLCVPGNKLASQVHPPFVLVGC